MASASNDVLTTKEVEPNAFTNLLVDKPEVVAVSSVVCSLLWILLIPVFGAPAIDTGGDAFQASSGIIPENQFTFKAGLRASVSTGFDPVCEDIDFSTFPGVGAAGVELLRGGFPATDDRPAIGDVSDCTGIMDTLASLSSSFTCDDDVTPYRPLLDAINLPLPEDVTSLRVICPKTCPNGCGDGSGETVSEHVYQSKPSNVLQLTFESWNGDQVDNVLTVQNMQRICDVEQRVHSLTDMSKYCLKVPAGATECSRMSSLCLYMTAQTTLEFTLSPGLDVSIGEDNSPEVKIAALLNLLNYLSGMQTYQLLSYIPELQLPPDTVAALAAQLPPGSISESGVLSGTSKYGVCTVWEPATQEGGLYTKITFSDCSIPNGEGDMVSTDAQVLQVAQRLRDSGDINAKTTLLTKDFIDGKTDKVSATKMTAMFGVPYNVDTFDVAFSLSPLSESDCRTKFAELEVSADTCEGVTSFVSNQMRPQHRFEGPTSSKYVAETHDPIAKEWWEMLQCGRLLQNYNAQCVEDMNKKEQQFLFDIFADDILLPELKDKALVGENPYTYSGDEGELRVYFSEFSRMVQMYFDSLLQWDGFKAGFAMVFSYLYIIFHTRDFGLSTVGMIHIIITIPVSLSIYLGPLGFDRFNTLCPLGIFVILGIGADDIFIMVDCWKQSLRYFPPDELHKRMAWTWVRGSHAMLTTTMTTAVAFFANVASPIAPICVFGIFSGLLVVVNYVFVITWFPAMIIMKEKNMLGYFIPAYCGCCVVPAPLSYIMWKKKADSGNDTNEGVKDDTETDEKGGDAEEEAPDSAVDNALDSMTAMERFFFDVYAPLIDKLKIPIVVGGTIISIIFFIFAVQLKPSEEAAQFLPDHDPMQRNIDLSSNPEKKVFDATSQQQFLNIFMGAAEVGIDRDHLPMIPLDGNEYGIFMPEADFAVRMSTPAAIDAFTTICENLRQPTGAGQYVRRVDNPEGEVFCVFDGFKTWLAEDRNMTHTDLVTGCTDPCNPVELFAKLIADYSNFLRRTVGISSKGQTSFIPSFGNTPADTLRFDFTTQVPCGDRRLGQLDVCRPLLMVQIYANMTFKFNSPAAEVEPVIDAVQEMLDSINAQGTAPPAKQTAVRYVGIETENALSMSATRGTVISMLLALVCIVTATNNYLVTAWSMLVIFLIVVAVVGTMVMIGWTLGVIESICITIVVGLSVDYTIHLCHIFASSTAETRFEAGRDALASMGVSVFNAAITTLGSAIVLMSTYIVFFTNFGIFVFMNIFFSVFYAFAFLMAILMLIGPIQGAGTIYRSSSSGAPPSLSGPDLVVAENPVAKDGSDDNSMET